MSDNDVSPPVTHGARLRIDLAALAANWRILAARSDPAECAAAVKGDAYGLGLIEVSRTLIETGCRTFFVAHLSEARRFRDAFGADPVLYVLNGLLPGSAPEYATLDARPVMGSAEEVEEWRRFRADHAGPACALYVDTGFHRLGFDDDDLIRLATTPGWQEGLDIALLIGHLACADDPAHPMNQRQLARFEKVREALPGLPASIGNSGGLLLGPPYHLDLVRPGISLYGGRAQPGEPEIVSPVVTLEAPVIQVRSAAAGDTVGYSATYRFRRPSKIALLSIGYADGFPRALSGTDDVPGGNVWFGEAPAPVIGRVSMDITAVDVTGIDERLTRRGAYAEIIGPHQSADILAAASGTIDYEIFTRLGSRFERIYSAPTESA